MKRIKKRLLLLMSLFVFAFSVTACGSDLNDQKEVYGIEKTDIQAQMASIMQVLSQTSKDDALAQAEKMEEASELSEGKEKEQAVLYQTLFENWAENTDTLGEIKGFGSFSVEKAGKTVTATQDISFTKRDGKLVFTYKIIRNRMKLTSINVNVVYSMGETMRKAGLNVVLGMAVVFAILIIISLAIYAFRIIPFLEKKFGGEDPDRKKKASKNKTEEVPLASNGELVAVISAAIAAASGTTTDDFVVRRIRRRY